MNCSFHSLLVAVLAAVPLVADKLPAAEAQPAESKAESEAQRDARMKWWREARFGMFIHWGIYPCPPELTKANRSPASANGS